MEGLPLIPDDRADAVLDACPTFESRRAAVSWHVSDLIGAMACVVLAIACVVML